MTRRMHRLGATVGIIAASGCGAAAPPQADSKPAPPPEEFGMAPVLVAEQNEEPKPDPPPPPPPDAPKAIATPGQFEIGKIVASPSWADRQKTTSPVQTVTMPRLRQKWSATIGKTTFRTTMLVVGKELVIGTHGKSLSGKNERDDGVYFLDAATGKRKRFVKTPGRGDLDVGGVAVDTATGRLFFTTDNGQIVATTLDGKPVWTAKAQGKVRPAPALGLFNDDQTLDIVVGDERGVLRALDGQTGKELWHVDTGVNDYDARGFLGAAAVGDLDGDGRDDVVAGARDGVLAAYTGRTGRVLWQHGNSSGIHASPTIADFDLDGRPEVLSAWSYGNLAVLDGETGALRWGTVLQQDDGGIEALFGSPTPLPGAPGVIVSGTSWWGKDDGVIGVGVDRRMFKAFEGRTTSSAVVTDLDGDGKLEAIFGTEAGKLISLGPDGSYAVLGKVRGAVEAPTLLADADGNGQWELFVASNDGKLTCFETGSKATPFISRFRGDDPRNRGQLGQVKLGWVSKRTGAGAAAPHGGGGIRIDYLSCCTALQDSARRAPEPQNVNYLKAAALCTGLAAKNVERSEALRRVKTFTRGAPLPGACR